MAGRRSGGGTARAGSEELVSAALLARRHAYAPYSNYQVGAALVCEDGSVFTGCNVENSAYGLCLCAERVAMSSAVAHGQRKFVAMAIATQSSPPGSPCGSCRQFLHELAPALRVILCNPDDEVETTSIAALLPRAFGPGALSARKNVSKPATRTARQRGVL